MLCQFCGYILRENAAVCDRCGRAVSETPSSMAGAADSAPKPGAAAPPPAPAAPPASLGPLWSSPSSSDAATPGAPDSASAPAPGEPPAEVNPLIYTPAQSPPSQPPFAAATPSPAPFASQPVPAFAGAGGTLFGQGVQAGAVPQAQMRYAGFWRRFFAFVLDFFIVIRAVYAIFETAGIFPAQPTSPDFNALPISLRIMLLLYLVYCIAMEASPVQATLGKRALELAVTDKDGDRLSIARAIGRNLGKVLSEIILFIGFIMAGFTAKKQALHDMLAGCVVIRRPN